jgi:hypothetical protein
MDLVHMSVRWPISGTSGDCCGSSQHHKSALPEWPLVDRAGGLAMFPELEMVDFDGVVHSIEGIRNGSWTVSCNL